MSEASVDPTRSNRRTVRLTVLAEQRQESDRWPASSPETLVEQRSSARRVPANRDEWLRLAELVVGDWTSTLREALVRAVWQVGMLLAIGVVLGVEVAAAGAAVCLVLFLLGRRRSADR